MSDRVALESILQRGEISLLNLYGVELVSEGDRKLYCVAHTFGLNYKPSQEEAHTLTRKLKQMKTPFQLQ